MAENTEGTTMEFQEKGEGSKLGTLLEEGRRESSTSSSDFGNGDQQSGSCSSLTSSSSTTTSPSWAFPSPPPPPVVVVAMQCEAMSLVDDPSKVQLLHEPALSEMETMKERFAKLLLGEDMSGCGNGVSTALAISNAITNLCATLFGQLWRLEPMAPEKKAMWRREIEWLLCVGDHIVELIPTWQTFPDGTKLEVMTCRPRSDLYVNLPALRKLDNMLIEILDSFQDTEFWYVDQGIIAAETDGSTSFRRQPKRQEEKWWLPVPRVPLGGLREDLRKQLQQKRDSTNQILKAAMAINSIALADMDVPSSYLENLPKNGRASLGELMYRYITSDQFSPECLLDCLDLSSEHQAIEIANRVESSVYLWRQKGNSKPNNSTRRSVSKSSWEFVKDLMVDIEKRELLADRAESLLLSLKQRFPGLPQTTLDMSKIQYNKDVGKAILESYSRVLESLAFNIIARIDDLLYVDDMSKHSDHLPSLPKISVVTPKYMVPKSTASCKASYGTPSPLSPGKEGRDRSPLRSPFLSSSNKIGHNAVGFKKALTDYVNVDAKVRMHGSLSPGPELISSIIKEESTSHSESAQIESVKESVSLA